VRGRDAILPPASGPGERLCAGGDAADVGCGMGYALNLLVRIFPKSRFAGFDIASSMIAHSAVEAATVGGV